MDARLQLPGVACPPLQRCTPSCRSGGSRRRREGTQRWHGCVLRDEERSAQRILGSDTPIGALTSEILDQYESTRQREQIATSTIYKELTGLRVALKLAGA